MKGFLLVLSVLYVGRVCNASTAPEQVHIALAEMNTRGSSTGMSISWFTGDTTETSTVKYGEDDGNLDLSANGGSIQYLKDLGFHHQVLLKGLSPNTVYFYQVGDPTGGWSSQTYTFVSAPDDTQKPFAMSIFGDMGYLGSKERPTHEFDTFQSNWSAVPSRTRLEALKNAGQIDLVWHIGDLSYADDAFAHHPFNFDYENVLNGWMNWMENVTSTMPYMVAVGNHESECHSPACFTDYDRLEQLKNFSAYNARWNMPSAESGGVLNMWYSFNYGPIHFATINTETDWSGAPEETHGSSGVIDAGGFAPDGVFMEWLEADLKAAAADRDNGGRQWLIVGGHRPFDELPKEADDMFQKYGVDMYFSGHVHSYARSAPVFRSTVDRASMVSDSHYHQANATTYIVVGGAGCDEMDYVADSVTGKVTASKRSHTEDPLPPGSGVGDVDSNRVSIGVLNVHNTTAVQWQLLDGLDGSVLDELWLTK